jgi:hypothetical protein
MIIALHGDGIQGDLDEGHRDPQFDVAMPT